jgi:group I intron endonuclease
MDNSFYVYCWTNRINGKQYVGKGKGDRAYAHLRDSALRKSILSVAIRKHGVAAFELRFLTKDISEQEAFQAEMHAIYVLECRAPYGYNRTGGGEGSAGYVHPPEILAKMSAKALGRRMSDATKAKIKAANKGKKIPEHVRAAALAVNKGRPLSPEHKAKLAAAGTGRKQTPETIAKVVARHLGSKRSLETREKIAAKARGRIVPPDVAKKRVASLVGRPQNPEHVAKRVAAIAKTKAAKKKLTAQS